MQDPIVAVAADDATADDASADDATADDATPEVSVEDAMKAAMATPAKAEFLIFSNYEFS